MSKLRPVGEVAASEVGSEWIVGAKGTWLQPIRLNGSAASASGSSERGVQGWVGSVQESPSTVVAKGRGAVGGQGEEGGRLCWF